jgi:hypothetical protein
MLGASPVCTDVGENAKQLVKLDTLPSVCVAISLRRCNPPPSRIWLTSEPQNGLQIL